MTKYARKVITRSLAGYDRLTPPEREAHIFGLLDLIPECPENRTMRDTLTCMLKAVQTEAEMQTDFLELLTERPPNNR